MSPDTIESSSMQNATLEQMNTMLNLDNQLCFALYVCSKEIVRRYTPLLKPLGLTYTSYITLLALWEKDNITVTELGNRLFLDSGTLTPLLKKLETQGHITRARSAKNERNVYIALTQKGLSLKQVVAKIPLQLANSIGCSSRYAKETIQKLNDMLILLQPEGLT